MTADRDVARDSFVAEHGGERWEIPGDEAFEAGWDAAMASLGKSV